MPVLDWIGKKAVVNHHREVPYQLLHCDKSKSAGDPDSGNSWFTAIIWTSFQTAANTLKAGLVNNDFRKVEADALVQADADSFQGFEEGGATFVHEDAFPNDLDFRP